MLIFFFPARSEIVPLLGTSLRLHQLETILRIVMNFLAILRREKLAMASVVITRLLLPVVTSGGLHLPQENTVNLLLLRCHGLGTTTTIG